MSGRRVAALYLRIRVRRARAWFRRSVVVTQARLGQRTSPLNLDLGPIEIEASSGAAPIRLRAPRLTDAFTFGPQLRAAAPLVARQHPRFAAPADAFAPHRVRRTWLRRTIEERRQLGRRTRYAALILRENDLVGEVSLRIDYGTSSGELLCWSADAATARAAVAALLHDVLTRPLAPERYFAEVQCVPDRPDDVVMTAELFKALGFHQEGVFKKSREYQGVRYDHEIWVAHNTAELLAAVTL